MEKTHASYHRENLEQQLLIAAAELVATRGIEALSLRALGRAADVSRTAAYHYFTDKDALLHRVGEWAFEMLDVTIRTDAENSSDPTVRVRAGFHAYLKFAQKNPHLMKLMFGRVLKRETPVSLEFAGENGAFSSGAAVAAFQTMYTGISDLPCSQGKDAAFLCERTNMFWAAAHGVALLSIDDNLKLADASAVLDRLLDALLPEDH